MALSSSPGRTARADSSYADLWSKESLEKVLVSIVDPADDRHESKLIIKDRKYKFRRHKSVFTGSNLLNVLSTSKHPYSHEPSEDVAARMVAVGIIERVTQTTGSHNGKRGSFLAGWSDKDYFRLSDDLGVNLKKVVRSVVNLKARIRRLEQILYDTRDSLNEAEADLAYDRMTFSRYIESSWTSQLQSSSLIIVLAIVLAVRENAGYTLPVGMVAANLLYLALWKRQNGKFLLKASKVVSAKNRTAEINHLAMMPGTTKPVNQKATVVRQEVTLERKRRMTSVVSDSREDGEILLPVYPGKDLEKETCWSEPEGGGFMVRGSNYLVDNVKVRSQESYLEVLTVEMAALETIGTLETMAGAPKSTADYLLKETEKNGRTPAELFVVTFLVPGYVLSFYCQKRESSDVPADPRLDRMWEKFYHDKDDTFRNERLKILPNVPEGIWVVKKTVGNKPAIAARAVDATWNRGVNYLEVVYDVSTSYVGNKIFSVVKGYAKKITLDLAFLIEGRERNELPERILCAARFHQIDLDKIPVLHNVGV